MWVPGAPLFGPQYGDAQVTRMLKADEVCLDPTPSSKSTENVISAHIPPSLKLLLLKFWGKLANCLAKPTRLRAGKDS